MRLVGTGCVNLLEGNSVFGGRGSVDISIVDSKTVCFLFNSHSALSWELLGAIAFRNTSGVIPVGHSFLGSLLG